MAVSGNMIGGLWLVLIGWFLRGAAISSYRQHVLMSTLTAVTAAQAMSADPDMVPADATVREIMDDPSMRRPQTAYPVVHDGATLGLVTDDALRGVPAAERDARTARDLMTDIEGAVVAPDDDLMTVIDRVRSSPTEHVLVMRDGAVLGMISALEVGPWLQRAQARLQEGGS
jgi:CBS domain-containing protein